MVLKEQERARERERATEDAARIHSLDISAETLLATGLVRSAVGESLCPVVGATCVKSFEHACAIDNNCKLSRTLSSRARRLAIVCVYAGVHKIGVIRSRGQLRNGGYSHDPIRSLPLSLSLSLSLSLCLSLCCARST